MSSRVSRDDIEKKLREIEGDLDEATSASMPLAITLGIAALGGAVGLAYMTGARRSRKQTTIVEVRRA